MKLNTSINILILFTFIIRTANSKSLRTRPPRKEKVVFVPPKIQPKILIFNLDRTIWPMVLMDDLQLPVTINKKHIIRDDCGNRLTLFPHTFRMLQRLRKLKFKLAAICYYKDFDTVDKLLKLHQISNLFSYKQFSYNSKFDQIEQIQNASKIPCDEMVLFDLDDDEFSELELLDLISYRIGQKGVLLEDIQEAWKMYATKKSQPTDP